MGLDKRQFVETRHCERLELYKSLCFQTAPTLLSVTGSPILMDPSSS